MVNINQYLMNDVSGSFYDAGNGKWGEWTDYGDCSKSYDSGVKVRTRQCDNPTPSHDGLDCAGIDREKTVCNANSCPGNNIKNIWYYVHIKICLHLNCIKLIFGQM